MKKILITIFFAVYIGILFYLLFFSAYRKSVEGVVSYNFIPFQTIGQYFYSFDGLALTDQFIGNMLAFAPLGFLLPIIIVTTFTRVLGYSFLLSLSVEVAQFFFRVGAFDVDDLILNVAGGGIGFLGYIVIKKSRLISN